MVISLLIYFLSFSSSYTQTTIDVAGFSTLSEDIEASKKEANKDAFINAVKTFLLNVSNDADFIIKYDVKLKNNIFNKIDTYVESYNVISEEKAKDTYKVNISVNIDTVKLKVDLTKFGIPINKGKIPKVISFVAEKKTNKTNLYMTTYVSKNSFTDFENNFSNFLSEKGFTLINPYESADVKNFPSSNNFLLLKTSELINYAKSYNADLIATGYLETNCKSYATNDDFSCTTLVSLQTITVNNAKIIFAKKIKETFKDKDENTAYIKSRSSAISLATDAMASQVNLNWKEKTSISFKVKVNNIKTYETFKAIITACENKEIGALAVVTQKEQAKSYLVLNVDTNQDNNQKSRNLILNKIKEIFNFKISENKNEIIIIDLI